MQRSKLQVPQFLNQSRISHHSSQYGESAAIERVQKSQDSQKSTKSCDEDTTVSPVWERHSQVPEYPAELLEQEAQQLNKQAEKQQLEVSRSTMSTFKRRSSPHPIKIKRDSMVQAARSPKILDDDTYFTLQGRETLREISKIKEILQAGKLSPRDRSKREPKETSDSEEDTSPEPKKHSLKKRSRSIHLGKRKTNDRQKGDDPPEVPKLENSTPSRRLDNKNISPAKKDREVMGSSSSMMNLQRRVVKMVVGPNRKRVRIRAEGDDQHSDSRNQSPVTRKISPSPPNLKPQAGVRNIKLSRLTRQSSPVVTQKPVVATKTATRKPVPPRTRKSLANLPNVLPIFFDMQRMDNHIAARTSTSREQQADREALQHVERLYTRSFLSVKTESITHHWGQTFTRPRQPNQHLLAFPDWNSVESVQGDEDEHWVLDADSTEYSQVRVAKPQPPTVSTWQQKLSAEQMYMLENFAVLANFENDQNVYRVQRTQQRRDIYMKPLRGGRGGAFDESRSYGFSGIDKVSLVIPKSMFLKPEQLGTAYRKIATNWRRKNDNYKDRLVQIIAMYLHHLPCFICKKTIAFSNLQQYFTHIIKRHQHIDSGFRCLLCNKDFYNWLGFEKHFDLKHTFA